jgi:hypothetical protein
VNKSVSLQGTTSREQRFKESIYTNVREVVASEIRVGYNRRTLFTDTIPDTQEIAYDPLREML